MERDKSSTLVNNNESKFWHYLADKSIWLGKNVLPFLTAGGFALAVGPKVFGYDNSNSPVYDAESVTLEEVNGPNKYSFSLPEVSIEDIITLKLLDNNGVESGDCVYITARKTSDGLYTSLAHQIKPCDSLDDKLYQKRSGFPID
ncbi:hypothetical protein HOA91_05885 [Candidatus Woesearchaeota archaeon]|jgi:hypothetical protein|nr:hypothetical protein [Candidatus Woesearchaeota archaeon]